MVNLKLKIDIGGSIGDEAWMDIRHFDEIDSAKFGPQFGCSGACKHSSKEPHAEGEWWGAAVALPNKLLAQYAISHYLEQERVLDAMIE